MSDLPPPTQSESTLGIDPPTPWWKRKLWKLPTWAWIVVGVFVVGSIASAGGSDPEDADGAVDVTSPSTSDAAVAAAAEVVEVGLTDTVPVPATPPSEAAATTPATTESPATVPPTITVPPTTTTTTLPPTTTTPAPESNLSPSQQNAVRSAESYLDFMNFSRQGLIDQLSSEYGEQFPVEDATVAVDSLIVDWNAQAAESAQSYLDMSGFSCQGLIDQLASEFGEQFTVEQATYGATQTGIC